MPEFTAESRERKFRAAAEADFTAARTASLAVFKGFAAIALPSGGANVPVMLRSNATGVTGNKITVVGRAAVIRQRRCVARNDVFVFSPTSLTASRCRARGRRHQPAGARSTSEPASELSTQI